MKVSKELIFLNLGIIFMSTSGIFGRLISIKPELAIFYRCLLAAIMLFLFIRIRKLPYKNIVKDDKRFILLGGGLLAFHWVTYFYALSIHSIAIAILTLHTFPVMTAIFEPLILKTKFHSYHLLLAILVMIGIWIILPSFDIGDKLVLATLFGIVSALSYALRNIWTKKVMSRYNGSVMMFYQVFIAMVVLSPYLFFYESHFTTNDWIFIPCLAFVTTVLGHTLLVSSLKHYSAVTVSLISCIIPIYGVLWGVIFINEIPNSKTIIGGSLILLSFIVESYFSQRNYNLKKSIIINTKDLS
ncbi:MAG: EamA family transporter [Saprospiraceae bacterium]|nr:EamA family transporter [Saprospiraceae bacterium]